MVNFLDELEVGHAWRTGTKTISEADLTIFTGLTGDYHPLHTSEYHCREFTQFDRRLVHGLLVLSISHGLMFQAGITRQGIAFAGIEDWRFTAPVFIGDTIIVDVVVREKIESRSKPDRGIVKLTVSVKNTDGTLLQEGTQVLMLRRNGT